MPSERERMVAAMERAHAENYRGGRNVSLRAMSAALAVAEADFARREAEIRADEREACAKIADASFTRHVDEARRMQEWRPTHDDHLVVAARQRANCSEQIAAAIRSRKHNQ